jgi:hypothetical protein
MLRAHYFGPDYGLYLVGKPGGQGNLIGPLTIRLACYAVPFIFVIRYPLRRVLPYALMAGLLLDVGTFWYWGWTYWPKLNAEQAASMRRVAVPGRPELAGHRLSSAEVAGTPAFRFLADTPPMSMGALYVHAYALARVDPCVIQLRMDLVAKSIGDFFAYRGLTSEAAVLADDSLARQLACVGSRVNSAARVVTMNRGYDWIHLTLDNPQPVAVPVAVSEAMYRGWSVRIDGQPAAIFASERTFLGARVPAGRHDMDFRFHTPAATFRTVELAIAGLASLWLLVCAAREFS